MRFDEVGFWVDEDGRTLGDHANDTVGAEADAAASAKADGEDMFTQAGVAAE